MAERDELVGTLADEEAAMRSGRGRILIGWAAFGIAAVVGLAVFLGGEDEGRVYRDLGKQINGLKQAKFDLFWGCALKGAVLRDLKSNTELAFEIDGRGQKGRRNYAAHVKKECLGMLGEIEPTLDTLIAPADLTASVGAMREATGELRSAWNGYLSYLENEEQDYSEETAAPLISKIGRAWFDFKKAHTELNQVLKGHLES
jgi:hypothetical protein